MAKRIFISCTNECGALLPVQLPDSSDYNWPDRAVAAIHAYWQAVGEAVTGGLLAHLVFDCPTDQTVTKDG
ncbi:MAG TPA: hypothetical protein VGG84_10285 [Gemmatimonadaceae bacterium]|jgi:hypothetical protein